MFTYEREGKEGQEGQEGFLASLGVCLLFSGYQVKNFIKEVLRHYRLLQLLGSIADGQPIEVRLKNYININN